MAKKTYGDVHAYRQLLSMNMYNVIQVKCISLPVQCTPTRPPPIARLNWSSVEHIPRAHIAQSIELLCVHGYNFANFRKLVEMLFNCTMSYAATGGPGDKALSLYSGQIQTTRRYELIRSIVCCNSITVLYYILVPQGCRFQIRQRIRISRTLLISTIFTSHNNYSRLLSCAHEQTTQ